MTNILKKINVCAGFVFCIFYSCSSLQVIQEPLLDRTTVKSESICFSFFTFCKIGSPESLVIRGIVENGSGNKSYFLDYYLSLFESDLPIGVSLKIDENYYILQKVSTDYSESVMVSSELTPEMIDKILQSKNLELSYSNRKDTFNLKISKRNFVKFLRNLQKVKESLFSAEKLNIVK